MSDEEDDPSFYKEDEFDAENILEIQSYAHRLLVSNEKTTLLSPGLMTNFDLTNEQAKDFLDSFKMKDEVNGFVLLKFELFFQHFHFIVNFKTQIHMYFSFN